MSRVVHAVCSLRNPSVDDFIGVETASSTVPKTEQGCPALRGIARKRLHCNHDNGSKRVAGAHRALGLGGGGVHPLPLSPNESYSRPRRFFLIAPARGSPRRYLLFSRLVRDPIYTSTRATRFSIVLVACRNTLSKPSLLPLFSFRSLLAPAIGNSMHRYTAIPLDCPDPKTAATS